VLRKLSVGRVARTQMRPTDQAHRRGKLSKASILIRPRRGRLDAVAINCIALNEPMNSWAGHPSTCWAWSWFGRAIRLRLLQWLACGWPPNRRACIWHRIPGTRIEEQLRDVTATPTGGEKFRREACFFCSGRLCKANFRPAKSDKRQFRDCPL